MTKARHYLSKSFSFVIWDFTFLAPRIFDAIAQLVRPIMSPGTRRGFKVFGYDKEEYGKFLFNTVGISPDQISSDYGGTKPKL